MKRVRSEWERTILVCGKCSRKLDGGFGDEGDRPLAKVLRTWCALGKGRKARIGIVETRCLDICPKKAVVMIDAALPERWSIVPVGTPVADVAALLGLSPQA